MASALEEALPGGRSRHAADKAAAKNRLSALAQIQPEHLVGSAANDVAQAAAQAAHESALQGVAAGQSRGCPADDRPAECGGRRPAQADSAADGRTQTRSDEVKGDRQDGLEQLLQREILRVSGHRVDSARAAARLQHRRLFGRDVGHHRVAHATLTRQRPHASKTAASEHLRGLAAALAQLVEHDQSRGDDRGIKLWRHVFRLDHVVLNRRLKDGLIVIGTLKHQLKELNQLLNLLRRCVRQLGLSNLQSLLEARVLSRLLDQLLHFHLSCSVTLLSGQNALPIHASR